MMLIKSDRSGYRRYHRSPPAAVFDRQQVSGDFHIQINGPASSKWRIAASGKQNNLQASPAADTVTVRRLLAVNSVANGVILSGVK